MPFPLGGHLDPSGGRPRHLQDAPAFAELHAAEPTISTHVGEPKAARVLQRCQPRRRLPVS